MQITCDVGIHWIACDRVSFIILGFLHNTVLSKLATSSYKVKPCNAGGNWYLMITALPWQVASVREDWSLSPFNCI